MKLHKLYELFISLTNNTQISIKKEFLSLDERLEIIRSFSLKELTFSYLEKGSTLIVESVPCCVFPIAYYCLSNILTQSFRSKDQVCVEAKFSWMGKSHSVSYNGSAESPYSGFDDIADYDILKSNIDMILKHHISLEGELDDVKDFTKQFILGLFPHDIELSENSALHKKYLDIVHGVTDAEYTSSNLNKFQEVMEIKKSEIDLIKRDSEEKKKKIDELELELKAVSENRKLKMDHSLKYSALISEAASLGEKEQALISDLKEIESTYLLIEDIIAKKAQSGADSTTDIEVHALVEKRKLVQIAEQNKKEDLKLVTNMINSVSGTLKSLEVSNIPSVDDSDELRIKEELDNYKKSYNEAVALGSMMVSELDEAKKKYFSEKGALDNLTYTTSIDYSKILDVLSTPIISQEMTIVINFIYSLLMYRLNSLSIQEGGKRHTILSVTKNINDLLEI
jgi:hypothetical protein